MREFYLFAEFIGDSYFIPANKLIQISVLKIPSGYSVKYKNVQKYYTSNKSLLNDWSVMHFVSAADLRSLRLKERRAKMFEKKVERMLNR